MNTALNVRQSKHGLYINDKMPTLYLDDNKARDVQFVHITLYDYIFTFYAIAVVDALRLRVSDLILTFKKNIFIIHFTPDTVQYGLFYLIYPK